MRMPVFSSVGSFGRTYAVMLASVLLAEFLIFLLLIATAPAIPPLIPFDTVVASLAGKPTDPALGLRTAIARHEAVSLTPSGPAELLSRTVARALGLAPQAVRATIATFGPPSVFGLQAEKRIAAGERPAFIAGDFTIARQLSNDRWRVVSTDGRFLRDIRLRFALLLIGTFAVVIPFAYALAQRTTRPIRRFAAAADRLGADPGAPPLELAGPAELRVASEALNRMQERLSRYVDERTTMLAAIAHDLRTPLMRMAFQIEDADPRLRAVLVKQIDEMRSMINAVLGFVRDERGRHERNRLDWRSVVASACDDASDAGSPVQCALPDQPVIVLGDPQGLRSICENLIGNAVTYGTSATVTLTVTRQEARLVIADQGPGLSDDDLERVFDPFFRVERSRSRSTGGAGLGLAVVRSIVVAHGGNVTLANGAEQGLEATVTLPLWLGRNDA